MTLDRNTSEHSSTSSLTEVALAVSKWKAEATEKLRHIAERPFTLAGILEEEKRLSNTDTIIGNPSAASSIDPQISRSDSSTLVTQSKPVFDNSNTEKEPSQVDSPDLRRRKCPVISKLGYATQSTDVANNSIEVAY